MAVITSRHGDKTLVVIVILTTGLNSVASPVCGSGLLLVCHCDQRDQVLPPCLSVQCASDCAFLWCMLCPLHTTDPLPSATHFNACQFELEPIGYS